MPETTTRPTVERFLDEYRTLGDEARAVLVVCVDELQKLAQLMVTAYASAEDSWSSCESLLRRLHAGQVYTPDELANLRALAAEPRRQAAEGRKVAAHHQDHLRRVRRRLTT